MKVRCYDRQIVYLAAEKVGNGDMDVENILEEAYRVPSGHSNFFAGFGIGNNIIPDYNKMYKKQVSEGRQCYVICPMVEDSENIEAENVIDYTDKLRAELKGVCIETVIATKWSG